MGIGLDPRGAPVHQRLRGRGVTAEGLGATLGVAVTGAIFSGLQEERTVDSVRDHGVAITREQASDLHGLLAGAPGARHTLDELAGRGKAQAVEGATREAFVSALGTALKLSGALVVVGFVLAIALMRRRDPRERPDVFVGSVTPRPAPRAPP